MDHFEYMDALHVLGDCLVLCLYKRMYITVFNSNLPLLQSRHLFVDKMYMYSTWHYTQVVYTCICI